MEEYNNINPLIKTNWNLEEKQIYLDLIIQQPRSVNFHIEYKTHEKVNNKHLYIAWNLFHPITMKKAFIKTEIIRILRTNNNITNYQVLLL